MKKILISPYLYIGLVFIIFVIVAISNTYAWFNWQSTDDLRFEVKIGNVTPPVWTGTVNKPNIQSGLTPIKWDNSLVPNEIVTTANDPEWYSYIVQSGPTTSGGTSRWANAKTNNGSYLVWIPRYEYKITSGYHTAVAGTIEVKFIPTTQTVADPGYIIHPVFRNAPNNGGWDKELDGIWVGKFESSVDGSGNTKIVPNILSEMFCRVSDGVIKAQQFGINNNLTNYDSHMMKNTEWGAVAYLAHSGYGRNGTQVTINNSRDDKAYGTAAYTGYAGYTIDASHTTIKNATTDTTSTSGTFPYNNTYRGVLASTTGNIYGVYDMAGGWTESVMAVLSDSSDVLTAKPRSGWKTYSSSGFNGLTTNGIVTNGIDFPSPKYYDLYLQASSEGKINNYNLQLNKKGDAIYETSSLGDNSYSWFGDNSTFIYSEFPWLERGGSSYDGTGAGMFSFSWDSGNGHDLCSNAFRIVVTP